MHPGTSTAPGPFGSHSSHSTLKSPTAKGPSPRQAIQCPPSYARITAALDFSAGRTHHSVSQCAEGALLRKPGVLPLEKFVYLQSSVARERHAAFSQARCATSRPSEPRFPLIAGPRVHNSGIAYSGRGRKTPADSSKTRMQLLQRFPLSPLGSTPSSPLLCPSPNLRRGPLSSHGNVFKINASRTAFGQKICGLPPREIHSLRTSTLRSS